MQKSQRTNKCKCSKKAILWQKIIKNKILNQAFILKKHNKIEQSNELINLAKKVSLNDSKNIEAVAAALYFKTLFGVSFSRDELCFENSALNYGYAIIRAFALAWHKAR